MKYRIVKLGDYFRLECRNPYTGAPVVSREKYETIEDAKKAREEKEKSAII